MGALVSKEYANELLEELKKAAEINPAMFNQEKIKTFYEDLYGTGDQGIGQVFAALDHVYEEEIRFTDEEINEIKKVAPEKVGIGSLVYAIKPGDGSAREQAASCQKVLGGWANIANEYATKRYRSNLINWGMVPFIIPEGDLPFANGDYIFIPQLREAIEEKLTTIPAYVIKGAEGCCEASCCKEGDCTINQFDLQLGELTDDEREIILKGCLINYNRV
jgi:aconitase A